MLAQPGLEPGAPPDAIAAAVAATRAAIPSRAAFVMLVDGQVVHHELDEALAARGLKVSEPGDEPSVGEVMTDATDLFAELNTAFAAAPIVIEVPDGLVVEAPIVVASFTATNGIVTLPRFVVRAGADSRAHRPRPSQLGRRRRAHAPGGRDGRGHRWRRCATSR